MNLMKMTLAPSGERSVQVAQCWIEGVVVVVNCEARACGVADSRGRVHRRVSMECIEIDMSETRIHILVESQSANSGRAGGVCVRSLCRSGGGVVVVKVGDGIVVVVGDAGDSGGGVEEGACRVIASDCQ